MLRLTVIHYLLLILTATIQGISVNLRPHRQEDSITDCDAGLRHQKDSVVMYGHVDIRPNNVSESDHIEFIYQNRINDKAMSIFNVSLHNCSGFEESVLGYCQNTKKEGVYIVVFNATSLRYHGWFDLKLILHQANAPNIESSLEALPTSIDLLDVELLANEFHITPNTCDLSKLVHNDVIKFCCYTYPATCNVSIKANLSITVSNETCVEYRSKSLRYTKLHIGYTFCQETTWIRCQFEPLKQDEAIYILNYNKSLSNSKCEGALKSGTDRVVMKGILDITELPYSEKHEVQAQISAVGQYAGISLTLPKIDMSGCYFGARPEKLIYCLEHEINGFYIIVVNITAERIFSESEIQLVYLSSSKRLLSSMEKLPFVIHQSLEIVQINGENLTSPSCHDNSFLKNQTIKFCCYAAPTTCTVSMLINEEYQLSGITCVEYRSISVQFTRVQFNYSYCGETKSFACELTPPAKENVYDEKSQEPEINWAYILTSVFVGACLAFMMKFIFSSIHWALKRE